MINRLIAVVLCLFGMVAWVQATPNVTAEITYDLVASVGLIITSGTRKSRLGIMHICGMNVRTPISSKPVRILEISRQYKFI